MVDDDLAQRATGLLNNERRRQLALELAARAEPPTPEELRALLSDLNEIRDIPNPADELDRGFDPDDGLDLGR